MVNFMPDQQDMDRMKGSIEDITDSIEALISSNLVPESTMKISSSWLYFRTTKDVRTWYTKEKRLIDPNVLLELQNVTLAQWWKNL